MNRLDTSFLSKFQIESRFLDISLLYIFRQFSWQWIYPVRIVAAHLQSGSHFFESLDDLPLNGLGTFENLSDDR